MRILTEMRVQGAGERDGRREDAKMRGCRLRQRCGQPTVPDVPKGGQGIIFLQPGLLQAKLGRSVSALAHGSKEHGPLTEYACDRLSTRNCTRRKTVC
jgi:hypothetical protein